jgi:hypothetical protein
MEDPKKNITRREALKWSIPLFAAAALPGMLQLTSCKPSAEKEGDTANNNQHRKPKKTPVQRGNPYANRDEMFLHNKTKTLHYPYVFKTYDQLKEEHFTSVSPNEWEKQLDENGAHFSKEKSALIFERLALKNLNAGINNEAFGRSSSILGRSFTLDYAKQNIYNWRGYNLLFQMLVLSGAVATGDKWAAFSNAIKEVNVSQIKKIPKKHAWIASQQLFDQRVQYIQQHADEYMGRLKKRSV